MDHQSFDVVSRQLAGSAAGRLSLLALGAAGLITALAGPFAAEGKKKNGNNKKGNNKKKTRNQQQECPPAADLCAPQVRPCVDVLTPLCNGDPSCQDQIACCSELGACDFGGFLSCLIAAGNN